MIACAFLSLLKADSQRRLAWLTGSTMGSGGNIQVSGLQVASVRSLPPDQEDVLGLIRKGHEVSLLVPRACSESATWGILMPGPRDRPAAAYSTSWEIKLLKAFGDSGGQWVVAVSRELSDWLPDVSSKQRTSTGRWGYSLKTANV